MDAYVYQAALLCADCAKERQYELELHNMWDGSKCALKAWPHTWQESDYYPQGPHADGGGEADTPQHCDGCGCFLRNSLTTDGCHYVNEKLIEHARDGDGDAKVLIEWAKFYNACYYEPGEVTLGDLQFEYSMEDDDWDAAIGWWFTIAGELYTRGAPIPDEWQFKPGIRPVDADDNNAVIVASATIDTLMRFMEDIEDDVKRLEAEGRDY
jgi:hypothetical protein